MTHRSSAFAVVLASSPDGSGVQINVTNTSDGDICIQFPNPYTGIRLFKPSGEMVPMDRTFLCWEEDDPKKKLRPGESASALALLYPFWQNLHGTFLARCTMRAIQPAGGCEETLAEGTVAISLKEQITDRTAKSSAIPQVKPVLLNVSRYVSILEKS